MSEGRGGVRKRGQLSGRDEEAEMGIREGAQVCLKRTLADTQTKQPEERQAAGRRRQPRSGHERDAIDKQQQLRWMLVQGAANSSGGDI
eukprot:5665734-Pleurochrysis_carterae.AAC.2